MAVKHRRKLKTKKIDVPKPLIPKEQVMSIPTKPDEATSVLPHFHYALTQHYVINLQEPSVEDHNVTGDGIDGWFEQQKRMFHVILLHPDLLQAVCKLNVLQAMDAEGGGLYVDVTYGDMNYELGNVLTTFIGYFTEEDQEEIRNFQGTRDERFSILNDSFKVEENGFQVDQYRCSSSAV